MNATANQNKWGYNNSTNSVGSASWKPVPVGNTGANTTAPGDSIASTTSGTNTSTTNLTLYYGANVTTSQPSGTYSREVKYTATANGNSDITATSASPTEVEDTGATNQTVKLVFPFYGLIDDIGTLSNKMTIKSNTGTSTTCTPTLTGANATQGSYEITATCTGVSIPAGTAGQKGSIFLAIAKYGYTFTKAFSYKSSMPATMQDFTASYCNTLTEHEIISLADNRDNNTYNIIKAKDGNCWMTENLRLGKSNNTMTLSSSDSNITSNYILPQAATTYWSTMSYTDGNQYSKQVLIGSTNMQVYGTTTSLTTGWTQAMGNYYTWYTATANSGSNASTSCTSANTYTASSNCQATQSICPQNWQLPYGSWEINQSNSPNKSFGKLMYSEGITASDTTGISKLNNSGLNFPPSGYEAPTSWNNTVSNNGIITQGIDGRAWSSTSYQSD